MAATPGGTGGMVDIDSAQRSVRRPAALAVIWLLGAKAVREFHLCK